MPELPDVLVTDRLRLVVIGPAEAKAMIGGRREPGWHPDFPLPDDLDAVSLVRADGAGWGPRRIVRINGELTCGTIGFTGPPAPAADGVLEAEVGYGLVPDARGRGVVSEALAALLRETDRLGVRVRAGVRPENAASLRALAKAGFTELRAAVDDSDAGNADELIMVRPLHRPAAGPAR